MTGLTQKQKKKLLKEKPKRTILKYTQIMGNLKDLHYDQKVERLNVELAIDSIGSPLLVFQDWTKQKSKDFFKLHIHEALELKAIIDSLISAYHIELAEPDSYANEIKQKIKERIEGKR